jgi:hypothetical protein
MSAFEFNNNTDCGCNENVAGENVDNRRVKEECIIAFKVYDSCRQQDCLTANEIGPARAAKKTVIGDECIQEGEIIDPPSNAAAVTIDNLFVKKVIIVDKCPNPFKNGFWDVDLKYVFQYRLTFREADGTPISSPVCANSIFNKKVTLFGSIGSDLVIATDLFKCSTNDSTTLRAEPFIFVEAKAVALSAELRLQRRCSSVEDLPPEPNRVNVTIGLFTIIKLYRLVNLNVESRGFCIPKECEDISPLNPCDFFESLDFPMDVFAPPQKPEFLAGISSNIPSTHVAGVNTNNNDCGCNN